MGYYVTLNGRIEKDTVELNATEFQNLKEKYPWISFDEYSIQFDGNWSDDLIEFFKNLSKILIKGSIIIDCDGDIPRDIGQYKITPEGIWQRNVKRIVFEKWKPAKL